jgi:uncharacterized protein (DUF924 family)
MIAEPSLHRAPTGSSAILDFWFEGDPSERRKKWFEKNPEFDAECARFTDWIRDARIGRYDGWATTPKGGLALIILLDQLSRNVFRGLAEAFAADPHAHRIARRMIEAGFDVELTAVERMFVYLPFEHAENMDDQNESVRLFESLRDTAGADTIDYAHRHRDVIREFGRFPHRNAALGRSNTAAEEAWLAQPGSSF